MRRWTTGNWPVHGAVRRAVVAAQPEPKRDGPRRHGLVRDQFVRGHEMAARCGFDMLELHVRARLSAVVLHHAADQQAHRRVWRLARKPHALSAGDLSARYARCGPTTSRSRCAFRPMTGSAATASRRWMRSRSRGILQAAGVDICDVSAGQTSVQAKPVYGRMFQTPFSDRIRNETGMATHGGRQHLRARPRQFDPDGRPRRPRLPGAAASRRPVLDPARGGSPRRSRRNGRSPICRAAISSTGWPSAGSHEGEGLSHASRRCRLRPLPP